jgi:DNA-binding NarL/FixJ family response regulator
MKRPRVLLADDHTLVLEAFSQLLSDDCDVVGTASNGRELLTMAARLAPEVVVVDVTMPVMNGIDAARQLKRDHPAIRIIVLTMNEDRDLAAEAFRAGASGYVLKRSAATELLAAIAEVMKGRSYVTPLITEGLVGSMLGSAQPSIALTERQREIVQLVAGGHSMKEVATILEIAPHTVAFQKYRIMRQLRLKTTADLIQYAIKQHIV